MLDSVSAAIPPGECVGIVGENGSGKSTDQTPVVHLGRRGVPSAERVPRCGGRGVTRSGVAPLFPEIQKGIEDRG
ncbi:ATP-binding cassette domain-containing protein [Nocardia salmonicida]|uniref:ATP-binding cassette domain-containing protein n=1 Tax=Nocardia salmonicida TaxID=53431 RepID=UPI003653947D